MSAAWQSSHLRQGYGYKNSADSILESLFAQINSQRVEPINICFLIFRSLKIDWCLGGFWCWLMNLWKCVVFGGFLRCCGRVIVLLWWIFCGNSAFLTDFSKEIIKFVFFCILWKFFHLAPFSVFFWNFSVDAGRIWCGFLDGLFIVLLLVCKYEIFYKPPRSVKSWQKIFIANKKHLA